VLPLLILLWMLVRSGQFPINMTVSSVTQRLWKRMLVFSLFVFSGQFLNVVARTADTIVISSQSANGLSDTAVFTIATYLITIMDVPLRGMTGITTSIIAKAWRDRDLAKINSLYKKTALNLLVVGLAIFCVILLNMNNAMKFLGPEYGLLPKIVLIIGLAKIIDLGTGLNSQILLSSKFWRVDFITNMCFVFFSIVLNVMLVKRYNLIGSAYATVISYFVYNLTRFVYIWKLFKLQPYSWSNLKALAIAAVGLLAVWQLPKVSNIFVDSTVRGLIFIAIYGAGILYLQISEDITSLYHHTLQRVRDVFKTK
jgi:O-antigen/teichoic acid export membrane protein